MQRLDRLGAFVTFLGALIMLAVVTKWPDNEIAAFAAFSLILIGVGMRLWR